MGGGTLRRGVQGGHKPPCLHPPPGSKAGSGVSVPGRQRGLGVLVPQLLVCGHLHLSLEGPDLFQGHVWKAESRSPGWPGTRRQLSPNPGLPSPCPHVAAACSACPCQNGGAGSTGRALEPVSPSSPRGAGERAACGGAGRGEQAAQAEQAAAQAEEEQELWWG